MNWPEVGAALILTLAAAVGLTVAAAGVFAVALLLRALRYFLLEVLVIAVLLGGVFGGLIWLQSW